MTTHELTIMHVVFERTWKLGILESYMTSQQVQSYMTSQEVHYR